MTRPEDGGARPSSHPTRPPTLAASPPASRERPDLSPLSVPTRIERPDLGLDLDVRSAFLLLHADGREALGSIGDLTALPFEEVRRVFAALAADGLVSLTTSQGRAEHAAGAEHATTPPPR